MAVKYGLPGSIKIAGKEIAHMGEWSLEQTIEIKEGSFFKGTGKEKSAGISDWTASCSGQVDFATESGQKDVMDAFQQGEPVEVVLYLNDTTFFTGNAFIESLSIDNSAEGEYNIEISLAGNGGITATIPTESP